MLNSCRLMAVALVVLCRAAVAQESPLPSPPAPDAITQTMRSTLTHGVQLIAAGDFAFAEGHFRAIYPPKPTTIYLNLTAAPAQYRRLCHHAALAAAAAWNEAAPDIVQFVIVDNPDVADITVHFEPDVASNNSGVVRFVCGICSANMPHDGQGVDRNGMIRIAVAQEGWGTPLHSSASLQHIIGHELGHYLGIGESPDMTQLMGPDNHKGTPVTKPTPADVQRLRDLLALADQLTALAQRREKIEVPAAWQAPKQTAPAAPSQTSPKPGEVAPDFQAKDLDGNDISLAALKGKVVLLDFWATWCGPCKADLPNLRKIVQTYRPGGLVIIAISLDSEEQKLRDFVKEQGLDWPQLFDGKGWQNAIAKLYNVHSIPHSLLIGPDGVIVRRENRATSFEDDIKRLLEDQH